jgi:hypothetical protein
VTTDFDWRRFLQDFSRDMLADTQVARSLPQDVVASGWLGFAGAPEDQIREAEQRLGRRLPPSYRSFLGVSNGWRNLGAFIDQLWPVDQVDWFRVRNQEWIDAYTGPYAGLDPLSDDEYFTYGEEQDPARFRTEYLGSCLEISATGDDAVLLLNPEAVTPEGEWEAWFFANWNPGAVRYRSFRELMDEERRRYLQLRENRGKPMPRPPSLFKTLWREMREAWRYGRSGGKEPRD